jgi:hypothetical protein
MPRTQRILLSAAITATALLNVTATASANRLNIDDQAFDIRWSPMTFVAGVGPTRCNLTLLGSFHTATIAKAHGTLIGHITHASVGECNPGVSATMLASDLPWHVQYRGFSGSLPSISSVTIAIIDFAFRFDPDGLPSCLFVTSDEEPAIGIASISGSTITEMRLDENAEISLEGEGSICSFGGSAQFSGTGAVEDLELNSLRIGLV